MLTTPDPLDRRSAELRRDIRGRRCGVSLAVRTSPAHGEAERLLAAMRFNASLLEMMRIITIHCGAADRRLHNRDLVRMRRACVYI